MNASDVKFESLAALASREERDLRDLYALIHRIDIAMLTTWEPDGSLVSRPMATQKALPGIDIWFMTSSETHKVEVLQGHPEVNVMYFSHSTREWVSVSGTATLSRNPARIGELYQKSWKAWLSDRGPPYDGGPDDPRIVLIDVHAHGVTYFKSDDSRPVMLLKMARAMLTGQPPHLGEVRHLNEQSLSR
jgi:general stress protein 26